MINNLDNNNFKEEIKNGYVLIDFYANWCGPCKMMHPILEEISKEKNIKIITVDVDKYNELAREYGVMSIPNIFLFKDGNVVEHSIGYTNKEIILKWLDN